jgi:hypothetical protein
VDEGDQHVVAQRHEFALDPRQVLDCTRSTDSAAAVRDYGGSPTVAWDSQDIGSGQSRRSSTSTSKRVVTTPLHDPRNDQVGGPAGACAADNYPQLQHDSGSSQICIRAPRTPALSSMKT